MREILKGLKHKIFKFIYINLLYNIKTKFLKEIGFYNRTNKKTSALCISCDIIQKTFAECKRIHTLWIHYPSLKSNF